MRDRLGSREAAPTGPSWPPLRLRLALVLLVVLALDAVGVASDPVSQFRSEWNGARSLTGERRKSAELSALGHLKGVLTTEAAQAALGAALDGDAAFESHEAAVAVLKGMSGDPARGWIVKEATGHKDARARALLCTVVGTWGDGWRSLLPALKDKEISVVAAASDALSRVKEKDVVAALVAALKDAKEPRTQADLSKALKALTGLPHRTPGDWDAWWLAEGARFAFDAPPPAKEAAPSDGIPRTTSNGSGLYETISSNRVIFILDTSFSMRITGEVQESASEKKKTSSRLEFCQRELAAAIESQLNKKCFFNVIAFSTKITPWKPKLVEATEANKKAAKGWVLGLLPEEETNTFDALEMAFSDKTVDTIYLLTDGFPTKGKITNMESIRGEVRKWNDSRKVRINTICYVVGDGQKFSVTENKDMSKGFMRALAEENGGFCKVFD